MSDGSDDIDDSDDSDGYLDNALLQHDETIVSPAGHQKQQRLWPRRPEPE